MAFYYLDSSALVKLVIDEVGSEAMRSFYTPGDLWFSADITRTEVPRCLARLDETMPLADRRAVLDGVALINLDAPLYDLAGSLQPSSLRSLDAIHVAAALTLGSELTAFVTYDHRLADAAERNGLRVLAPGVDS